MNNHTKNLIFVWGWAFHMALFIKVSSRPKQIRLCRSMSPNYSPLAEIFNMMSSSTFSSSCTWRSSTHMSMNWRMWAKENLVFMLISQIHALHAFCSWNSNFYSREAAKNCVCNFFRLPPVEPMWFSKRSFPTIANSDGCWRVKISP